jgi:hypothetical protein
MWRRETKRGKAVSVGIQPIWAPEVLIQVLREWLQVGFSPTHKRTEGRAPVWGALSLLQKPLHTKGDSAETPPTPS